MSKGKIKMFEFDGIIRIKAKTYEEASEKFVKIQKYLYKIGADATGSFGEIIK